MRLLDRYDSILIIGILSVMFCSTFFLILAGNVNSFCNPHDYLCMRFSNITDSNYTDFWNEHINYFNVSNTLNLIGIVFALIFFVRILYKLDKFM